MIQILTNLARALIKELPQSIPRAQLSENKDALFKTINLNLSLDRELTNTVALQVPKSLSARREENATKNSISLKIQDVNYCLIKPVNMNNEAYLNHR